VSPDDPDEAYFLAVSYSRTKDGGATTETAGFFGDGDLESPGWDHHDMWIDPTSACRMAAGFSDKAAAIVANAEELDGSLIALEETIIQLKVTGTGQDRFRWPTMVSGRLAYLAGEFAVAVADFPPTDQHREVHQILKARLAEHHRELDRLLENELPAFNRTLEENDLPRVVTGGPVVTSGS
jgi:hypothetical protein